MGPSLFYDDKYHVDKLYCSFNDKAQNCSLLTWDIFSFQTRVPYNIRSLASNLLMCFWTTIRPSGLLTSTKSEQNLIYRERLVFRGITVHLSEKNLSKISHENHCHSRSIPALSCEIFSSKR